MRTRAWIAGIAAAVGCQSGEPEWVGDPPAPAPPTVTASRRAAVLAPEAWTDDAVRAGDLAFRPAADGGVHAREASHDVRIADDRVELTLRGGAPVGFRTRAIRRGDVRVDAAAQPARVDGTEVALARGAVTEVIGHRGDGIEQRWWFDAAPAGDGDLVVEIAVDGHAGADLVEGGIRIAAAAGPALRYSDAVWIDATGAGWAVPAVWRGDHLALVVPAAVLAATEFPAELDPVIGAEQTITPPSTGPFQRDGGELTLAWNGTSWYVGVWNAASPGGERVIRAARIRNGAVVDRGGFPLAAPAAAAGSPTVGARANQFYAAWEADGEVARAGVTFTGLVVGGSVVGAGAAPSIGNQYGDLLAYRDGTLIRCGAQVLTSTAAASGGPAVAIRSSAGGFVTWIEASGAIRGVRVNASCVPVAAAIDLATGGGAAELDATWADEVFWVTWRQGDDIRATRITTATPSQTIEPLGGAAITTAPGVQDQPVVRCLGVGSTSAPDVCLIAWRSGGDVRGQRVANTSGPISFVGAELGLATGAAEQGHPALAPGDAGWLVGWDETRDGVRNPVVRRLDAAGVYVDPAAVPIDR